METEKLITNVIDACYHVQLGLSAGYLESVYKNALLHELILRGLQTSSEVPLYVEYKGVRVGDFRADIIVENKVIIEIKAVSQLNKQHEVQLVNYLTCTGINDGILVNFGGDRYEIKRKYRILLPH